MFDIQVFKYLIDLESPSSLWREFDLNVGTILNCLAFVRKCNEFTNKDELT